MIDAPATGLAYLPLKFSRNKLSHTIEAADPDLASRVGLKYLLTLLIPIFPFSETLEELHTSESREKPMDEMAGIQVFAGADFGYNNGRNGKIDGLLTYTKPKYKQSGFSTLLGQTMAYCLKEGIQGGIPEVDTSRQLPKMYAIKAGLSNEDFYAYGDNFFNGYQLGARQFLTWQPNYKRVCRKQEEYLYFLVNFTPKPQELRLRMQCYKNDGSAHEEVTCMTLINPVLYSVVCCPAGADVLQVPADVVRYDVWLSNEFNKRVSEVRSYIPDTTREVFDRSILFVNSLGGWDTLRLTGQASRNLKISQTVAEIDRPADAGIDFSELKIVSITGEYEIQISTGWFKRDASAYLKYLNELLLSEEIYLLTEKGHKPLQLVTNGLVDEYDNADMIARTFAFRILDTVENYSNLPATEPVAARATKWRGLNMQHVLDAYGKRTGKLGFARIQKIYVDDESEFKPVTIKLNTQGDPDYIQPVIDSTIVVGSTPFPNTAIARAGKFKRTNCAQTHVGGPALISIPAGTYGGEAAGDADALAESRFESLDTQAYANTNGTCTINNTPFKFGLFHKIPMNSSLQVEGSADYGPVVDLRISSEEIISNSVGINPPTNRFSENTYMPGIYNIIVEVEYANMPTRNCLVRIPSKNREMIVKAPGHFVFENLEINSTDNPLTVEITNL